VTTGDLVGIMPYEDDLVVLALPGDRLEEALAEVPLGYHFDGPPNRLCSHVSGARLVWNDRTGEFQSVTIDGDPIDPDRQYSLAVAEYLVETSHVSSAFDGSDVVERCGLAHDAIVEYAREVGIDPELEGRIERPQLRE
jgi:2',3'-cyclic-nucleotide 2'-phosphodiesterase (5'-nucleotidase family)